MGILHGTMGILHGTMGILLAHFRPFLDLELSTSYPQFWRVRYAYRTATRNLYFTGGT